MLGNQNTYQTDVDDEVEVARDLEGPDGRSSAFQELYDDIKVRLTKAYKKSSCHYNLRRRNVQYVVGQEVYRRNFVLSDAAQYYNAKLAPKFIGPFVITRRVSPWTYELTDKNGNKRGTWNVKDLKPNPAVDRE